MLKKQVLVKNAAKCLKCGDIIESKYSHNYVSCSCGSISIDGGTNYAKRVYTEGTEWEELSEYRYYQYSSIPFGKVDCEILEWAVEGDYDKRLIKYFDLYLDQYITVVVHKSDIS